MTFTPAYSFSCRACKQGFSIWSARCSSCLSLKGLEPLRAPVENPIAKDHSEHFGHSRSTSEDTKRDSWLTAVPDEPEEANDLASPPIGPIPISEISETSFTRYSTGMAPIDQVLGGGLVAASVVLLAAFPGTGKSTITLQMLVGLKQRCLYVTGEETIEQLAATGRRVGAVSDYLYVLAERNLSVIFDHARGMKAQIIAIDSIQKMLCEDLPGRAGSVTQLRECTARLVSYAKTTGTILWLIGHVTSDGDIAGPKTIEHDVDVVLELDRGPGFNGNERILKSGGKNRFGATNVEGRFELTANGLVPVDGDGWPKEL